MRGRSWVVMAASIGAAALAGLSYAAGQWTPSAWKDVDTLEFLTVGPEEGRHWSTVWLVVIDNQVYVRLGPTAAGRMEKNTAAPEVSVKIAGQQFDHVRAVPVPDQAKAVGDAMADKYWSDIIIHHFNHPLTMRLEAPTGGAS